MNILFVNSEKIGSKIIMYGLDSNISHVAIGFEDHEFIYHAIGDRIQQTKIQDFFDHYNLIDFVEYKFSPSIEKKFLKKFLKSIWYQSYDYRSIFYFALDRFKVKFMGRKPSTFNPMNSDTSMICTEVLYVVDEIYHDLFGKNILPLDLDLSITKPSDLRTILKKTA
jgi:hypothetical protein